MRRWCEDVSLSFFFDEKEMRRVKFKVIFHDHHPLETSLFPFLFFLDFYFHENETWGKNIMSYHYDESNYFPPPAVIRWWDGILVERKEQKIIRMSRREDEGANRSLKTYACLGKPVDFIIISERFLFCEKSLLGWDDELVWASFRISSVWR